MVLNQKKCHYIYIMCHYIQKNRKQKFEFDNLSLENSKEKVALGVPIDNKLIFDNQAKNIC